MRWERLFDDLEARLAGARRAEFAAEVADRAQNERSAVALLDRIAAHRGRPLVLVLTDGGRLVGIVTSVLADGVLLDASGRDVLVPAVGIVGAEGLENRAASRGAVEARLRFTTVLRTLSAARVHVAIDTRAGTFGGVILAVGADHLDLRADAVTTTLPLAALIAVRSAREEAR